jgi:hypothetical protein
MRVYNLIRHGICTDRLVPTFAEFLTETLVPRVAASNKETNEPNLLELLVETVLPNSTLPNSNKRRHTH